MNTNKVSAGKPKVAGAIFRAPLGTTLPTNATATLDPAFKELGYASEDGVTNSSSFNTEKIQAWGGDTVLRTKAGKEDNFNVTLIEALNVEVLKTTFGDENVTGNLETGIIVKSNNKLQPPAVWVFDMILNNALKRIVIPIGSVIEVGEVTYGDNNAIGYAITLAADPDSTGNNHYEYIQGTPAGTEEE